MIKRDKKYLDNEIMPAIYKVMFAFFFFFLNLMPSGSQNLARYHTDHKVSYFSYFCLKLKKELKNVTQNLFINVFQLCTFSGKNDILVRKNSDIANFRKQVNLLPHLLSSLILPDFRLKHPPKNNTKTPTYNRVKIQDFVGSKVKEGRKQTKTHAGIGVRTTYIISVYHEGVGCTLFKVFYVHTK